MNAILSAIIISRLQKAATDNGFDQESDGVGGWLEFASTQCPLRIWLCASADTDYLAAFSQQSVVGALWGYGAPTVAVLPVGAVGARAVPDVPALHRLLRRAFQFSRALPDELLHTFQKKVATLPRTTEAERLVVQRVGQDVFREGLLDYWEGRCAVTGLAVPDLLRASHIRPWAECDSDAERLDVYNGILLAPHLDVAFDQGYITVANDGAIIVSNVLDTDARAVLGLSKPLRVRGLAEGHRGYLPWHREWVFSSHP